MSAVHDLSDLVRELRARRAELRISQEQLAAVTGLNRRVIGELERGHISPRFETVLRIANGLGLDIELRTRGR
jgi:transcriptional regulator with XRE-family HTH domain